MPMLVIEPTLYSQRNVCTNTPQQLYREMSIEYKEINSSHKNKINLKKKKINSFHFKAELNMFSRNKECQIYLNLSTMGDLHFGSSPMQAEVCTWH